jgi:aldehyde:ferredoxin oxidoreductase
MMGGYTGKLLRVDLLTNKTTYENLADSFHRKYVGGWGFIGYYLLKELKPMIDPLGPENKLIFAAGPITGVPIAGNSRNAVGAKSPLTGGFGAGEAGGFWGAELKHAGFDAIIVEGKAEKPVYIWVHDGEAEIRDADHLWGLHTKESQERIRRELGDKLIRTAQIGPGGEKIVRYACIINDLTNAIGRSGMGAVMGSKNLKAVATRGHESTKIADPEKIRELSKWMLDRVREREERMKERMERPYVPTGNIPIRNFRDGVFPQWADISSGGMLKAGLVSSGMVTCFACPLNCKGRPEVDYVDPDYADPEYETTAALGSCCGVGDPKAILKVHELCNKYSIDSIATGVTIAFAMECFEKGLLTEEDTGGIQLTFGNAEAMLKTVEMIGKREGIGDLLAEGSMRAAKKIGGDAWKYAVNVKGQELPMHEPRLKRVLGLGYAVSPTGADHMHNIHDTGLTTDSGITGLKPLGILEPRSVEDLGSGKIRMLIYGVNLRVLDNCAVMCMFPPWTPQEKVEIFKAVTGWDTSLWELAKVGERAINMARVFNLREGFTDQDDWLPDRMFHPQSSGPLSDTAVNPKQLMMAKHRYYRMMGWDENTGIPKVGVLEELDIPWVAEELVKI